MRSRLILPALSLGLLLLGGTAVVHAETKITSSNSSDNNSAHSGDAEASNESDSFVGHNAGTASVSSADITNSTAAQGNIQEGDNDFNADQSARSRSGAAVTGQHVAGIADEGDLTIDATNLTNESDAISGDADSVNDSAAFVGLATGSTSFGLADITNTTATGNVQEGDNLGDVRQLQEASSGNALSGQVVSGVTRSGEVSVAAANTSTDSSSESGNASEEGSSSLFVGLQAGTASFI